MNGSPQLALSSRREQKKLMLGRPLAARIRVRAALLRRRRVRVIRMRVLVMRLCLEVLVRVRGRADREERVGRRMGRGLEVWIG